MTNKQTNRNNLPARGPGRPKGSLNKTPALLKDAILMAARMAGNRLPGPEDGLVKYLNAQAFENPGPFLALVGKVLPLQVTGADGGDLKISFTTVYETSPQRIGVPLSTLPGLATMNGNGADHS